MNEKKKIPFLTMLNQRTDSVRLNEYCTHTGVLGVEAVGVAHRPERAPCAGRLYAFHMNKHDPRRDIIATPTARS